MLFPIEINFPLIFLTSFFIFGWNYVTDYERDTAGEQLHPDRIIFLWRNPFWFLRFYSIKYFGQTMSKPLFTCVICMASVYGTLFYILFSPTLNIQTWAVAVVAVSGLNRLLKSFS